MSGELGSMRRRLLQTPRKANLRSCQAGRPDVLRMVARANGMHGSFLRRRLQDEGVAFLRTVGPTDVSKSNFHLAGLCKSHNRCLSLASVFDISGISMSRSESPAFLRRSRRLRNMTCKCSIEFRAARPRCAGSE